MYSFKGWQNNKNHAFPLKCYISNKNHVFRSCHTTWQSSHTILFFISITSRIFTFSLMERTSRLLLRFEALPASLLLRFEAIITVNKGFMNRNTAITRQLIRTARTPEAECWQVCGEAWVRGLKKKRQVLGAFWAAGFHHVTAHSRLALVLKLMYCLFL
jgi:hypothetical protein